jgi:hypothetical protein
MSPGNSKAIWWIAGVGAFLYLCGRFVRSVANAVASWELPSPIESEGQLRKSLSSHLRASLPESVTIEEFGAERSRADIVVASSRDKDQAFLEKVAIELKYRLGAKAELDRLVGQVVGYKQEGFDKAMVVSVDPEPNMREVLRNRNTVDGLSGFMMVLDKSSNE